MMKKALPLLMMCSWIAIGLGCKKQQRDLSLPRYQYRLLTGDRTGLDFENVLHQTPDFNVFNYMYFYNGGGTAVGDFNRDGLQDLYFTSNMGPNQLYLNRGNLQFENVTDRSGVGGIEGWTTGASIVDINNDGLLDIYVGQMGDFGIIQGRNQLFVCRKIVDGIPVFEDRAADYNLDLIGFSTQAAFFDYDLDGDLDMYQLNHSLHQNGTFGRRKSFTDRPHPLAGDKLMRNDNGKFADVTQRAGIYGTVIGYGLGIAVSDIDLDGWPDIYIGNDFHENDYLYLNQQDGTFREVLTEQINHTSRFSMGLDIADINNDGFNEILSLDMLPYDPFILKSSLGEDGFNIFKFKLGFGYNPQFARNNLQLNNGNGTFSEIAMFSGIHATDWSWAPLFLDFDHDGYRDLFISNGIPRRMNDIDYINFKSGNDLQYKEQFDALEENDLVYIEKMPQIKLPNKFFRNRADLTFEDINHQILNDKDSYSNGAIASDLDNDGDLDIVVNNIEDYPFIYENLSNENATAERHFLILELRGSPQNIDAIGSRLVVFKGSQRISSEQYPVRGYQSSISMDIHIGLGDTTSIDSVVVIWPDLTYQRIDPVPYNSRAHVAWRPNLRPFNFNNLPAPKSYRFEFADITKEVDLNYEHRENAFIDFNREPLIPHMVSAEGPALAVGDVNNDGREDVFIGSSKRMRSALYLQKRGGTFQLSTPKVLLQDSLFEDVDAVFADIENDGDLDLVVASGGNEFRLTDGPTRQRAYLNDGRGNFTRSTPFPGAALTSACLASADFDGDGLVDFFFGARAIPRKYGLPPTSFLFRNLGGGEFENVTRTYAPELEEVGMIKDGTWQDIDHDGDQDLILAVEWQPVLIFRNDGSRFVKVPVNDAKGWWNFILPHDFDQDGDVDLLAGNVGTNTRFRPTKKHPMRCYVNDFDDNGQIEQILTYYLDGREIPFANYAELTKQIVSLKKKYLYAKELAAASLNEIFGREKLAESLVHEVNTLQSVYFENTGNGSNFVMHYLPDALQLAPLNAAAITHSLERSGTKILLGGNSRQSNIEMGWYDAGYGHLLALSSAEEMEVFSVGNLAIKGEVRNISPVTIAGQPCYIFAKNNGPLQIIRHSIAAETR